MSTPYTYLVRTINGQFDIKAIPIGPSIPTENDYDPEVLEKAEKLKEEGNEHFKSKFLRKN